MLLGTPAEEGGGGKILMARAGAFDGVDAAMMVHPAGGDLARMDVIAVQELSATYTGRAAHAAAFPHLGRNALDAAVLGYLNVAALRQHIRPDERVHGIFPEGGDKPNIVPARAVHRVDGALAAASPPSAPLKARVAACLEAGAPRPGCEVDARVEAGRLRRHARQRGHGRAATPPTPPPWAARWPSPAPGASVVGSTDMGNVSYLVPSIHPMIAAAPAGVADPHPRLRRARRSPQGDRAVLDGAIAMAWTVADLWLRRRRGRRRAGRVRRHHGRAGGPGRPEVRDRRRSTGA